MPADGGDLTFDKTFALLDAEGRLVDWDEGLAREFAVVAGYLVAGARLDDLLAAAAAADGVQRGAAYRDGERTVQVSLRPTMAGGFVRTAEATAVTYRSNALFETADERWSTGGDPAAEAVAEFRVQPDGSQTYSPVGEDTRALWGLGPDIDMNDIAAVLSRVVQTPAQAELFATTVARIVDRLEPHFLDVLVRGHDGRLRSIRFAMTAVREAGGVTRIAIRMRDVTREKLAEDQLELLRSAVDHATDSIQVLRAGPDGDLRTIYVNRAFERMTGWAAVELLDGDPRLTPGWGGAYWSAALEAAAQGVASPLEFEAAHRSGRAIWIEASAKLVEQRRDGSVDWIVVSRNVDERRAARQDLLAAKEAAEAASRTKSEFLANMSHEIRTPMNGVLGMIGLLLDSPLDEEQRRRALAVEQSGEALLTIINDILDISKLEAGKVELERVDFDLRETVEAAVALLAPGAQAKGVELRVEVEAAARIGVRGDPNRLRQVVLNLVGNGIKFTPAGRVSVGVAVIGHRGAKDAKARLRFTVADTGIGMTEDACGRLFQKFSQADSSIARRYGGTGLGLAISQQLVELMGGRIRVDSTVGAGSTFSFEITLPVADLTSGLAADQPTAAGPEAHGGLRVLLAEDHPVNQQFALAVLAAGGHVAELAVNGREAVEAAARADYDVILMDVQMPECDGLEATRLIRAMPGRKGRVHIIALTADAMSGSREQYVAAGMDDYLSKPIKPADLLSRLAGLALSPTTAGEAAFAPERSSGVNAACA